MTKSSISYALLLIIFISFSCQHEPTNVKGEHHSAKAIEMATFDTTDFTNDFYDNAETHTLAMPALSVLGEVSNPGEIDLSKLPLRSVIVKETRHSKYGNMFEGAFRYDGYSLHDILNLYHLAKKNEDHFKPIVDLYVEVENEKGEKVVVSWGEIFYTNHLHEIIIATQVTRIIPTKSKNLWTLPTEAKLVVNSDLLTERNISSPNKITVKSYDIDLVVEKGKSPLYSATCDIYGEMKKIETLTALPKGYPIISAHTIFYGRGRGLHSTDPFNGVSLREYLSDHFELTPKALREGIFVCAADDGYRGVYSYSEICNRNDMAEVLLVCDPEKKDGGIFRVYPACDFFSDRAVKGLNAIYYSEMQLFK